jgi:iron uptake system component EfeO
MIRKQNSCPAPVARHRDPTLGPILDERFAAVDALLETYRVGDGYRLYTELTEDDIRKLAGAIDALGEPGGGVITS